MKLLFLVIGLLAGAGVGVLWGRAAPALSDTAHWNWPDSLDAVTAAPRNHKVVFENSQIRILEVILEPFEFEPMHTHSHPSVMFGADNDTSSFDIVYYAYTYDQAKHRYLIKDSISQHQSGQGDSTEAADLMKPEGPHRVRNLSNTRIVAFRVEFKSGTKSP